MRNIIPLLIFCIIFPMGVYANPPETPIEAPIEPKVTGIQKGEIAPYSGVLFNPLAAARILTDKNYSDEECKLKIDFYVQKEIARMNLLLNSTKVSMDSMEQKYTAIVKIKDIEIERLSEIALKPNNDYSAWWAAGGVLVGIGLTIAVVYAVGELK